MPALTVFQLAQILTALVLFSSLLLWMRKHKGEMREFSGLRVDKRGATRYVAVRNILIIACSIVGFLVFTYFAYGGR